MSLFNNLKTNWKLFQLRVLNSTSTQLQLLFFVLILSLGSGIILTLGVFSYFLIIPPAISFAIALILIVSRQWDRRLQEVDVPTGYEYVNALLDSEGQYPTFSRGSFAINVTVQVPDELYLDNTTKLDTLVQKVAGELFSFLERTSNKVIGYRVSTTEILYMVEFPEFYNQILIREKSSSVKTDIQFILNSLSKKLSKSYSFTIKTSAGISIKGYHSDNASSLVHYARFASRSNYYEAEFARVEIFDIKNHEEYMQIKTRRHHFTSFLDTQNLKIVFQPIYGVKECQIYGYEALGRPNNKALPISITELLNDSEAMGMYYQLEKSLLHLALKTFEHLQGRSVQDKYLFMNLTTSTIPKYINDGFFEQEMFHKRITVEVTERTPIYPEDLAILRQHLPKNAQIAIDDFGTGYSNYLTLLSSHPDLVKVSVEFIRGIDHDNHKKELFQSIVTFAKTFGTKVLAEGVETAEEFKTVLNLGVDYVQGYFVGRPRVTLDGISEKAIGALKELGVCYDEK